MGRSILAVAIGLVLAFVTIVVVEMVSHLVYPPPPDFDWKNPDAMRELMAKAPAGALLIVALAYLLGTTVGAWFAAWFAPTAPVLHASLVGGLLFVAGIANLFMVPHPAWFWPVALATYPLGVVLGLQFARRR
jgi:hypothetical protein